MSRWMREISISYKAHFLCLITLICLTQSFRSFAWMGIFHQMHDKLHLTIPASQVLVSTASFPWSVKPIFGFVSNNTQNGLGNRRLSYLIVSSILSLLPWIALTQTVPTRASYIYLAILLITQNIGAAMVDVVVDAVVTEAARANRIGALQPILWLAIAFGSILGCICGGLGLAIFNLEGVFLLFSLFPILQLFACGLLGEAKLGQLDEGNYDVEEANVGDAPVDVDYYGMLNSFIDEEEYLDTIMLQALATEKRAVLRLPWSSGSEGTHVFAPSMEEKRENDEEDWIQIGQSGQEKEEIDLDATPVCNDHVPEIFSMDANGLDLIEELDSMEMEELQRHSEQLDADSACGRAEAVEGRGLWQELQATVSDILKQPAIMQPLLWFLITQLVTPNLSSIMLCCQADNSEARAGEATFSGASPMISWGGLMLSTFLFNHYLKHIHLRKVKLW